MNNPEQYVLTGSWRLPYIRDILIKLIKFHKQQLKEKILEVGCGTGEVTVQILLPMVPLDAEMTCLEKSIEMVSFARKSFPHLRINYMVEDIEKDLSHSTQLEPESFHRIFSIYCFHQVTSINIACRNLYHLLKQGGSATILFPSKDHFVEAIDKLATDKKWREYAKGISEAQILYHSANPIKFIGKFLCDEGFSIKYSQIHQMKVPFESMEHVMGFFKSINPFWNGIVEDMLDDYFKQIERLLRSNQDIIITSSGKAVLNFEVVSVVATKR